MSDTILYQLVLMPSHRSYQDVPSHLPTHVLSFSAVHIQNLSSSEASLKIRRCPENERNRSQGRNPCIVNISP